MATYQALSSHPLPLSTSRAPPRDDLRPSSRPVLFSSFLRERSSLRLASLSSSSRKIGVKCAQASADTATPLLPTKKYVSEKIPRWSLRAIKSFALAQVEVRKLKYTTTGTETLLMGILVEGTSAAAKFLRANGVTVDKIKKEIVNILGKSDLCVRIALHPPVTEQAQRALDWAVEEKLKSGDAGEITTAHILLGIWSDPLSAGHLILKALSFNDEKAKEVAKLMNEEFVMSFR